MPRKQVKLVFQLGYPKAVPELEVQLAHFASKLCGGCTTSSKTGWWCQDGAVTGKLNFNSAPVSEHTFELELTCEPWKFANVLYAMKHEIAAACRLWKIDIAWIHVTETEVTGHHFHIDDYRPAVGLSDNAMRMKNDPPHPDFHTN